MELDNRTNRNLRKNVLGALLSSLGVALGDGMADLGWGVPAGGWPLQDPLDGAVFARHYVPTPVDRHWQP